MAGVAFEEFSAPPGSELALPPLFGGNILESELETEVEFVDGAGLGGGARPPAQEEEEEEEGRRRREAARRKLQALGRRCREIEQVPDEGAGLLRGRVPARAAHHPAAGTPGCPTDPKLPQTAPRTPQTAPPTPKLPHGPPK
uniref:TCF3 fusion partner n=1 Tax=Accipiter nisus TaxID=211598 RepID=A0A8B9MK17_9AVES